MSHLVLTLNTLPGELWQHHLFPELASLPLTVVALGLTCKAFKLRMTCLVTGKPASYFQWQRRRVVTVTTEEAGKQQQQQQPKRNKRKHRIPNSQTRKKRREAFPKNYLRNSGDGTFSYHDQDERILECGSLSQLQWCRDWKWFSMDTIPVKNTTTLDRVSSLTWERSGSTTSLSIGCSRATNAKAWFRAFLPRHCIMNKETLDALERSNMIKRVLLPHGMIEFFDTPIAREWLGKKIMFTRFPLSIDPVIPGWSMPMDMLFKCLLFLKDHCTSLKDDDGIYHQYSHILRDRVYEMLRAYGVTGNMTRFVQLGTWLVAREWITSDDWTMIARATVHKRAQYARLGYYMRAPATEFELLADPNYGRDAMDALMLGWNQQQ